MNFNPIMIMRPTRFHSEESDVLDTLVLVGALAIFDARLAGAHAGIEDVLPDLHVSHRTRHSLFLGRPHDHDGD